MKVILKNTMSADIPTAFPAYEGETLDALLIDPAIKKLLDEVNVLNRMNGGMTYAEAHSQMTDFDRRWNDAYGLMGKEAIISGSGEYRFAASEDSPAELIHRQIEGIAVRSEGFTILPVGNYEADGLTQEPKGRLALLFKELFKDSEGNIEGECALAVSLENLESIYFEQSMSFEQAEAIIDYYVPHIRQGIDAAISDSVDEIEAAYALGNCVWDTTSVLDDQARVRSAINVYVEESLPFDNLPYVMNSVDAEMFVITDDGLLSPADVVIADGTLLSIRRATFISPYSQSVDTHHIVTAHLDCELHDDEKFSKPIHIMLPLNTVKYLRSIRKTEGM